MATLAIACSRGTMIFYGFHLDLTSQVDSGVPHETLAVVGRRDVRNVTEPGGMLGPGHFG
jgi:hypothetical protein